MQSTQGMAWDRLTTDLASLAGQDHRERPADMFALAVEHAHPASPACWPCAARHVFNDERRRFMALVRRIGADAHRIYVKGSRTHGVAQLAARYAVTLRTMREVLEHMEAA